MSQDELRSTTGREIDPGGVDHPAHYNLHPSGVECIELIRGLNFDLGSAVKYVMRRGEKGTERQDLDKAAWYLTDFVYDADGDRRDILWMREHQGDLGSRVLWDAVIAAEPNETARQFYLACTRGDWVAAMHATRHLDAEVSDG